MKFLIFLASVAVFGSVHCDQECFRAVFKECMKAHKHVRLCEEFKSEIECIYQKAYDCKMPFWRDALEVFTGIEIACDMQESLDKDTCYNRAINNNVCVEPMNEVMRGIKTTEDSVKANKQICNLYDSYSNCVNEDVEKNCHGYNKSMSLFELVFEDYRVLTKSLCQQLILPADEKNSRPDNFGMINMFAAIVTLFGSA